MNNCFNTGIQIIRQRFCGILQLRKEYGKDLSQVRFETITMRQKLVKNNSAQRRAS